MGAKGFMSNERPTIHFAGNDILQTIAPLNSAQRFVNMDGLPITPFRVLKHLP